MAECSTLQVATRKFKLKKGMAAIIFLDVLEEDRKSKNGQGKTRGWIRRREEKRYYNNIKDTPGYREMMRMTHDDFLEILMLVEPTCILLQ